MNRISNRSYASSSLILKNEYPHKKDPNLAILLGGLNIATAGTSSSELAVQKVRTAYKGMSKAEKKAFRKELKQQFKSIKKEGKENFLGISVYTWVAIAVFGLLTMIVGLIFGIWWLAIVGGITSIPGIYYVVLFAASPKMSEDW
ncbi:MAG: hypothetical protein AAF598_14860 [Bacteroidota bacterium]